MYTHSHDNITGKLKQWLLELNTGSRWCVLINADPDAMASAMALKRIFLNKVHSMDIMRVNEVTRPDNLAMIRYLRIPVKAWNAENQDQYTHFALLDSQPPHNKVFEDIPFSLIIDHHPLVRDCVCVKKRATSVHCHIRPEFGATSTMMSRALHALRIRPTPRLATALLYGIRTDTAVFERSGGEMDFRAYQWLSRHADITLLRRILRSEYLREWLPIFARAFASLTNSHHGGAYAPLHTVASADVLVAIADFFTRVHGLRWIAVSGVVDKKVIVVFRGDGGQDVGCMAAACFHDVGTAGGHPNLARAEFALNTLPKGTKVSDFILQRLQSKNMRSSVAACAIS
ncbi:MAG: DHH family phosphoesterase [Desulfovibrio sp.]|jgi:nanoRNase/pAp phosphatase (c-di-AMP/oligoRNAs hydrolase)|nr:DHH family phosphoesterase [Desulfovibrio sp.]